MQEPARLTLVAAVQALAEQPEAAPGLVLDAEIVAGALAPILAPPFPGDALRPLGAGHLEPHAPPAEAPRRAIRHLGQRLDRLGRVVERAGTATLLLRLPHE